MRLIRKLGVVFMAAAIPGGVGLGIHRAYQAETADKAAIEQLISTKAPLRDISTSYSETEALRKMGGDLARAQAATASDAASASEMTGGLKDEFSSRAWAQQALAKKVAQDIQQKLLFSPVLSEDSALRAYHQMRDRGADPGLLDTALVYRDECRAKLSINADEKDVTRDQVMDTITCGQELSVEKPKLPDPVASGTNSGFLSGIGLFAAGGALVGLIGEKKKKGPDAAPQAAARIASPPPPPPSPPEPPKGATGFNL